MMEMPWARHPIDLDSFPLQSICFSVCLAAHRIKIDRKKSSFRWTFSRVKVTSVPLVGFKDNIDAACWRNSCVQKFCIVRFNSLTWPFTRSSSKRISTRQVTSLARRSPVKRDDGLVLQMCSSLVKRTVLSLIGASMTISRPTFDCVWHHSQIFSQINSQR